MEDNLLKSLLNKVGSVLNGGSEIPSASKDNYIAWCSPGIPFQKADLKFAVKGINGKDSEETVELIRTAAEFSRFANSIPSSQVIGGTFEQNGSIVWDLYEQVLRFSRVPKDDMTEQEAQEIERLRKKLTVSKKVMVEDEETGDEVEKEIEVDSPKMKAYKAKMKVYEDAVMKYNALRIDALNTENKKAVMEFAMNGNLLYKRVEEAMDEWSGSGYKEEIEAASARIKQTSQRSMTLLKQNLQSRLERARLTDPSTNSEFCLTTFYPGNFIASDEGWTQFTFQHNDKATFLQDKHAETTVNAGLHWGLWKADANGKHSKDELHKNMESNDFEMKFKLTQVPLSRPWFSPEFLVNESWDWDQSVHQILSDGKTPPSGLMVAYPTTAVFIKDVEIRSSGIKDVYDEINRSLDAGGTVGWGPFSITTKHSQTSKEVKTRFDQATNTLTVEGMQLLAFKCFALPQAPNCKIKELV